MGEGLREEKVNFVDYLIMALTLYRFWYDFAAYNTRFGYDDLYRYKRAPFSPALLHKPNLPHPKLNPKTTLQKCADVRDMMLNDTFSPHMARCIDGGRHFSTFT